jgi:hypothetical protein
MITLAALRYRKIFAAQGGPVDRVEVAEAISPHGRQFQANAFLTAGLLPARREPRRIYSDAAGSGTHSSPLVARYIALSEAMERWAYAATIRSPDRARYGFDIDPMSNGMAAFPGWHPAQPRRTARFEAIERFNLTAWWEGMLPTSVRATPWREIDAVVIGEDREAVTVIVHKATSDGHAYGHAAAADFDAACRKAVVELYRHERVVRGYRVKQLTGSAGLVTPSELLERRSLFFASAEGHDDFRRRVATAPRGPSPPRRLAYDGPIPGPWSRYADVWRVAFHPVSPKYLLDDERYFLW